MQAEQREREGAITANIPRSAIIEVCVKQKFANTPSTESFPNLYPRCAANRTNMVSTISLKGIKTGQQVLYLLMNIFS